MNNKILVVDDEADVRLLCKVNLEFEGYEVIDAADGDEALQMIDAEQPDLMLLDVMMPGLDGWEVLARIRSNRETSDLPVVMLTALTRAPDQLKGWSLGISEYVTKPFNPIALSRTVKNAIRHTGDREHRRRQMLEKLSFSRALVD